jgi:hypothetical protein
MTSGEAVAMAMAGTTRRGCTGRRVVLVGIMSASPTRIPPYASVPQVAVRHHARKYVKLSATSTWKGYT